MEIRAEIDTKLNHTNLHLISGDRLVEDYQLPMLKNNYIPGILAVEGCEMEGMGNYVYEISGLVSMRTTYEKSCMRKEDISDIVEQILEVSESLQQYMLNPGCIVLKPEYIFKKEKKWYFCYIPGMQENLGQAFHELTEYFVQMLDYEDLEGICLAYELHKATLQKNYNLKQILQECEIREAERKQENKKEEEEKRGNIFSLTEDEELYEEGQSQTRYEKYEPASTADTIREEGGWWKSWRKAASGIRRKRWGNWEDLILESDN